GGVVLGDFGVTTPTVVAIEKGYFAQQGLQAEFIPFKGGPDLLKGVLAGSADLGISGATDPLVFRERGTTIRAIACKLEKNNLTLLLALQIKRLEDLKGGTIGCTVAGSTTWVFGRMIAKKMGWDPEKDVRILGAGAPHAPPPRRGAAPERDPGLRVRRRRGGGGSAGRRAHPHAARRGHAEVDQPSDLRDGRGDQGEARDPAEGPARHLPGPPLLPGQRRGEHPHRLQGHRLVGAGHAPGL